MLAMALEVTPQLVRQQQKFYTPIPRSSDDYPIQEAESK